MTSSKVLSDVLIKVVKKCDAEKLSRIVGKGFMTEPILLYSDIRMEETEKLVHLLMDNILEDEVSLIAETEDGTVAGGSLALDFSAVMSHEFIDFTVSHRHFSKIVGLLDCVEAFYSKLHDFEHGTLPRGHSVHMFMLSTSPEFRNQGLGNKLRSAGLDHYKSKNYKFAMSEASSLFTRKICYKFGFKTMMTVPYASWFPEGSIYNKSVKDGHDAMHLMMKEL